MKQSNLKILTTLLILAVAFTACKKDTNDPGTEFAPQMYVSKPYEPYSQLDKHPINPKGLNVREPARGTIPRRNYTQSVDGTDSTGQYARQVGVMVYDHIAIDDYEKAAATLTNPHKPTDKVLEEGRILYTRFCYPCHGGGGKGDGPVAEQYKGVANLLGSAYTSLPSGHIFWVITNGKGRMWPHGSQVNPNERWKIVNYVFELQGRNGSAEPAEEGEEAPQNEEEKADSAVAQSTTDSKALSLNK